MHMQQISQILNAKSISRTRWKSTGSRRWVCLRQCPLFTVALAYHGERKLSGGKEGVCSGVCVASSISIKKKIPGGVTRIRGLLRESGGRVDLGPHMHTEFGVCSIIRFGDIKGVSISKM